jgi:hypothetical protein
MKVRFFTILAILILVIIGFVIYLSVNKDQNKNETENPPSTVTPTVTIAPLPTLTPVPVDYESAPEIYPAYQLIDGKDTYGYINSEGTFKINPAFDSAGDFHDGIAIVQMDDQYLAINGLGAILYSSKDPIADFHNRAAVISLVSEDYTTLYGYIDTKGNVLVKPSFKLAGNFETDDTAYVELAEGKFAQIDKSGKILNTFEPDLKYFASSIEDSYIIYYNRDKNLYGVVSFQGEEIFPAEYCEITYLGDDIFALKKPDESYFGAYAEMPAALFTVKGEQLTDFTIYDVTKFFNGYASATDSTYTYFIGKDGREATTLPKFEGRGTVMLYGEVVKARIDHELIYSKKDGTVIWQNASTQALMDGIVAKAIKFKPNKDVLVYYPQLEGLADSTVQSKINSELKSIFVDGRKHLKEEDKYGVDDTFKASMIKNLLIIEKDGYDYPFGAAHGSPIMDFLYFDTVTGASYQLKDLFIAGSDYINVINKMIKADIAASDDQSSMYFENGFTTITDTQGFILTPETLTIYFNPYDIAAYAAGFPKFEIPIEDLYDYIDFKGAFWGAFN